MADSKASAAKTRELNDRFRTHGEGNGSVMLTAGVQALGTQKVAMIMSTIRCFDTFTPEQDPWEEHDFGVLNVAGHKIFWKIDYYDLSLKHGAEDPANPETTYRALTIMLDHEY